jgi:uncharacterized protein
MPNEAPFWHDHEVWRWEQVQLPKDVAASLPRVVPIFLYHSCADEVVPFSHMEMYKRVLPQAIARGLEGRNHQLHDDLTEVAEDIRAMS